MWGIGHTIAVAQVDGNDNNIAVMDDCLPGDPAWNPTGGCALKPHQGDVPQAEFGALLRSPLTIPPNGFLIGHPSWRNEPSHLTVSSGKKVRVTNKGGRGHTFFGGCRLRRRVRSSPQHRTDPVTAVHTSGYNSARSRRDHRAHRPRSRIA